MDTAQLELEAIRRVTRRLIWFLCVLYIFAFLDRINIGFAALAMNRDLKLTATMFGFANTLLYIAYFLFSVPSNLALAKLGASRWLPVILIGWGIASTATMFAADANGLYFIRTIVGIFEAGFVPGVFLYLTLWFPAEHRARANSLFMLAMPITMALGSPISGAILDAPALFGVSSWRLLFLLEGAPSVLLGIAAWFYLTDNPSRARWLPPDQQAALIARLDRENAAAPKPPPGGVWKEVLSGPMLLLGAAYFGLTMTMNTTATWTPQIVQEMNKTRSFSYVGLLAAIPAVFTAIAMPLLSASSDRRKERVKHMWVGLLTAALGWVLVAGPTEPLLRMIGMILATAGSFSTMSVFWTVPPTLLSVAARPAGIGMLTSCGILASALSPLMVGFFRDLTKSFVGILFVEAAVLVVSAWLLSLTVRPRTA